MSEISQAPPSAVDGMPAPAAMDPKGAPTRAASGWSREVAERRERISLVIGLVAERYALTPAAAWDLLVGVSQRSNIKLREVARLIHDAHCHRLSEEDRSLAATVNSLGPAGARPLVPVEPASHD